MRSYPLLALLLSVLMQATAQQQPYPCGTTGKTSWLIKYQQNRQAYAENADTSWLYIPVTFHIVGTDAGGGYFPMQRVFKALCHMNSQYEPSRIKCYLHPTLPFNYLNNTEWYDHDWNGGSDLIEQNNIPDRLNAYIVDDPAGNCGYSWQDAIVLAKSCSGESNSTWGHELGHHLSLPHPFYGWEGRDADPSQPAPATLGSGMWADQVEKVERTNCLEAGDGFCDTHPDYISNRWNCDANGQSQPFLDPDSVAFRVDGSYIMGYANDACQSRFMPDQIEAMRANLNDEHNLYLVQNQHGPVLADDSATPLLSPLDTVQTPYNQVTFNWSALANADYYTLEVGLFASFNPTIHFNVQPATSTTYQYLGGLPKNRILYWRVKAYSAWDMCDEQNAYQIGVFRTTDMVATNELERNYTVNVSPNPASAGQDVQVKIEADQTESLRADLIDLNGRIVWSAQTKIYEGDQTFIVPTTQVAGGQYRLTLRNERGIISRTITVFE